MALLTLIARGSDGLPLSASIVEDESGRSFAEYQNRAKQIFRKLSSNSPNRCTIECEGLVFHYIIEIGICYLVLCEPDYPPRLAFSYLEGLHQEFSEQYGQDIHKAKRPYYFIEFGAEMNRMKKNYQVAQGRRGNQLKGLGDELQGVQKIMYENIDAVLQRGELVSVLGDRAEHLAAHSKKYRKEAHFLNLRSSMAAKIAVLVVIFLFLILLRYLIF